MHSIIQQQEDFVVPSSIKLLQLACVFFRLFWKSDLKSLINLKLGGGNSNIFYVHPKNWGNDPFCLFFFKGLVQPPTRNPWLFRVLGDYRGFYYPVMWGL